MNDTLSKSKSVISDAFSIFFGGITPGLFVAGFIMAICGLIFSLVLSATDRNPLSPRTPEKFNFWFMIRDNIKRFFLSTTATIFAIFFSLRFMEFFIGQKFAMIWCFVIGFGIDFVKARWRKIREKLGLQISEREIKNDI